MVDSGDARARETKLPDFATKLEWQLLEELGSGSVSWDWSRVCKGSGRAAGSDLTSSVVVFLKTSSFPLT